MKKIFSLAILLLSYHSTFAGDKVLNGGNVIVCPDNAGNIQSVELLDYYEVRLNGGTLKYNSDLQSYSEKLKDLFKKWEVIAPKRMALYTQWLNEFNQDAGIYTGISIPEIPDTGSISIPRGCGLQPVAFQRSDEEVFPGTKRYVINKDLWDLMNETQKAGLILHELIYREAIKVKNPTSLPTRFLNGHLASAEPQSATYAYIVSQMPLEWVEVGNNMVMYIGEMNCGWGNTQCEFKRTINISPDGKTLSGSIMQILGNVKTDEITMNFKDLFADPLPIKFLRINFQSESTFEFYSGYNYGGGSVDFYFIDLVVKNIFGFYDIKNKSGGSVGVHEIESASSKRPMRYYGWEMNVNSAKSWIKNVDNTVINNIFNITDVGFIFSTSDGKRWTYDRSLGAYRL